MKNRHIALLVPLLAAIALFSAACGGSDDSADTTPIIVVETPTTDTDTDASADTPAEEGSDGTDEDVALAFAQCMRDEGVDFPDPIVNADGSVDFSGVDRDADNPGFDAALDACSELLEGSSFLPTEDDVSELEDGLLAAAECLRDNGVDVPDPQIDTAGGRGPFGDDFDPNDPATAAAIDACQDLFAGLGR